jgi:uncharacterized protein YdhG (YjbR/CyaY superfamily)
MADREYERNSVEREENAIRKETEAAGWICPDCGRAFKKKNQSHYCGKKPETVDEYIAAQPKSVQPFLKQVRDAIREAIPDAQEKISWSMPTFWKGHNIIHFAGFKNHVGLYPGEEAVKEFSEHLKDYKFSKGSIQFPYSKPMPLELIGEIARWSYETGNDH